jgi:phosphomannomutase
VVTRGLTSRECVLERVARVDAAFPDPDAAEVTRIGPDVRKDYPDWWFCVRPSGAERGLLRITVEARDPALAAARLSSILDIIDR